MVMERSIFGKTIKQKHKSEMLSAKDLIDAGNEYRVKELGKRNFVTMNDYLKTQSAKDFLETMEEEFGSDTKLYIKNKEHWVHPYVFMDIALWINPKLKVKVYKWLHDSLLKNRDVSGNSYNKMTGIVFKHFKPFKEAKEEIRSIATAIQNACDVSNTSKKKWELATEEQLKLRNTIQDYICLLYPIMGSDAIDHAVSKAKEDLYDR